MVAGRKRQYESGEGSRFMTRNQALKHLQLKLSEFRKLCIIKGIYPREPRNRKRAQKGAPDIKILYLKKDIQFLLHDPNIWKVREYQQMFRRIRRAEGMKEFAKAKKLSTQKPVLKLDHIVKERYPTFMDAIRDLDDCLTLLFLYASFPHQRMISEKIINTCRRLTVEFMNYVIAAQALIKVFISIKGYYFQAEIKGEPVTWIMPHNFTNNVQWNLDVDFKIMTDFVDFYMVLLGFVNFRLYHSLNLVYPPKFKGEKAKSKRKKLEMNLMTHEEFKAEQMASLNMELVKTKPVSQDEEVELDEFPTISSDDKIIEARREVDRRRKLKTLFKGLKFYLGREVPREPLIFIIKCMGGQVSWSKTNFVCATYDETDESITHHIVDRPNMDVQYISRYYVQPQWVFDSVNVGELMPIQKYLMGVELPPHLSPFHSEHKLDKYIPLEEAALRDPALAAKLNKAPDENLEDEEVTSKEELLDNLRKQEQEEEEESQEECDERSKKVKMMSVKGGEIVPEDPYAQKKTNKEEYSLRVAMIKNKHRKLFHSMVAGRKKRHQEAWLLRKKRQRLELEKKKNRKEQRANEI